MATLRITQSVESELADIIASASDPESAAVATLLFLRNASQQTTSQPMLTHEPNGTALYDAVRLLRKATPSKTSYRILNNVLIECHNGLCTLRTSDLESFYSVSFRGTSDQGNVKGLIPVDALYKSLRAVKKSAIRFCIESREEETTNSDGEPHAITYHDLVVQADGREFMRIRQQFPIDELNKEFPPEPNGLFVHNEGALDLDLARSLSDHASTDSSVLTLQNAIFNSAYIGAADGFRALLKKRNAEVDGDFLAHADLLKDASMFLESADLRWFVREGETFSIITGTTKRDLDATLIRVCEEGNYPDLNRVAPTSFAYDVYIDPDDFLSGLKIVKPMAEKTAGIVRITVDGSTFRFDANNDNASGGIALDIDRLDHKPGEHVFYQTAANITFLKSACDALKRMGCDQLRIRFQSVKASPFTFFAGDASSGITSQIVVMPMHFGNR